MWLISAFLFNNIYTQETACFQVSILLDSLNRNDRRSLFLLPEQTTKREIYQPLPGDLSKYQGVLGEEKMN